MRGPRAVLCLTIALMVSGTAICLAGGIPERAVIVVNGDSWESRLVANEYRSLRQVPPSHLIEITGLSNLETIGISEFRERVLTPVTRAIEERNLSGQVEYVLYSADIPTAVQLKGDLDGVRVPQFVTPVASINGLTYLHELVRAKDLRYLDLQSNRYARRVIARSNDGEWTEAERTQFGTTLQRLNEFSQTRRKRAAEAKDGQKPEEDSDDDVKTLSEIAEVLDALRKSHPHSPVLLYNRACVLAQLKKDDEALEAIGEAVAEGYLDYGHMLRDSDLARLRDKEPFKALIERMKATPLSLQPTLGFDAERTWSLQGEPVPRETGQSYWLSTVLAVVRGRGLTVSESVENLKRAVAADGSRPKGTVYFEHNGDVRSTTREWAFRTAAERLEALGVKAVVEPGVLPVNRDDVAGAVIGTAAFDWPKSGSRILPGAVCEHLTSFGGILTAGAGQTPLTDFLRQGAAGSSGTVTEPYAIQAKFPTPFLHVHYAEGCSLAEAYYQSVSGPYQLLIVGDALCQPWRRHLDVEVEGLAEVVSGTVELTPKANSRDGLSVSRFELYVDGRREHVAPAGGAITWDTTRFDDGYHEVTVVAVGTDAVRTSARLLQAVTVRNTGRRIAARCATTEQGWDLPVTIDITAEGAERIELRLGARFVGRSDGGRGTMTVDPRTLGPGPVDVLPVAIFDGGPTVRGTPVRLRILSPDSGQ